jgi:HAD superfamily hydrolase (TIGR01509 family)
MNKAFIFDMDGVLIDSERVWATYENDMLEKLLGVEITRKIGSPIGISIKSVYEKAKHFGFKVSEEEFQRTYNQTALRVYERANITKNTDKLVKYLITQGFHLGLLTSSHTGWTNKVLPRLSFKDNLESIISLNDHKELPSKPHPDGYLYIIKKLGAVPKSTIILEDANPGITAAKNSGAYTIAFTENLVEGYKQITADAKAKDMDEVLTLVKKYNAALL